MLWLATDIIPLESWVLAHPRPCAGEATRHPTIEPATTGDGPDHRGRARETAPPGATALPGAQPTPPPVLPAIPSTWRSPITPCQGARERSWPSDVGAAGPLTRCDSPEGGRWDGRQNLPKNRRCQAGGHPGDLPLRRGGPSGRTPVRRGQSNSMRKLARDAQPPPSPRGRPALPAYRHPPTKTGHSARLWITTRAVDNPPQPDGPGQPRRLDSGAWQHPQRRAPGYRPHSSTRLGTRRPCGGSSTGYPAWTRSASSSGLRVWRPAASRRPRRCRPSTPRSAWST